MSENQTTQTVDNAPVNASQQDPIYIRIMLGFAGWIAAVFIMVFFFALLDDLFRSAPAMLVIGGLLCAGAWFLYNHQRQNEFFNQFAFSVSLAGQGMLLFGIFKLLDHDQDFLISQFVLWVSVGLFVVIKNTQHRIWSSIWIAGNLFFQWHFVHLDQLIAPTAIGVASFCWLFEYKLMQRFHWFFPVNIALLLLLTAGLIIGYQDSGIFISRKTQFLPSIQWLYVAIIASLVTTLVWYQNQRTTLSQRQWILSLIGVGLLAALSYWAFGISAAIALLLIAFFNTNRVLLASATVLLISYFSYYYYDLQLTLLTKSIVLMVAGSLLLATKYAIRITDPYQKEQQQQQGEQS